MRAGARVRRVGQHSVVDIDGIRSLAVSAQVDRLGFGPYQWIVLLSLGIALVSDCIESGTMEPTNRALDIAFNLPLWARAALPAVASIGSLIGIALAGPVCDQCGRKSTLVFSLALAASTTLAIAALPLTASPFTILVLRITQGFAGGFGTPCLYVLLVESCPTQYRTAIMYGAHAFSASGYLIGALGLHIFMPGLGQSPTDRWRQFNLFVTIPPLLSLPLVIGLLSESPYFYAVRSDTNRCVKVLNTIARKNRKCAVAENIVVPTPSAEPQINWEQKLQTTLAMLAAEAPLILVLCAIDGGRTFMTSGSAYLWPQLFVENNTKNAAISPALMNVVASISPFAGLAICAGVSWIGPRRITLVVSGVATMAILVLTRETIRATPATMLLFVIMTKCCYGPLHASVSLMKTEAFPTEVRATSFAIITVVAGLGRTAAPTIAEIMKGDNEEWEAENVVSFLLVLAVFTISAGLLVLLVPANHDNGAPLEDFVREGKGDRIKRTSFLESYGATVSNIWATNSDSSEGGADSDDNESNTMESNAEDSQARTA